MEILTPAALGALVLVPVLILLHLRRRRFQVEEVSSLLIWREVIGEQVHGGRRLARPEMPLLLLQVGAITLLVLSLARPAGAPQPAKQLVVVLDDSLHMRATDVRPSRLDVAKEVVAQQLRGLPADSQVTLVVATAHPAVLMSSTDLKQVRAALAAVQPTAAAADLTTALRLAIGALRDDAPRPGIVLVRGPEDVAPSVTPAGLLTTHVVGSSSDNQAVLRLAVRCLEASPSHCVAFAALRNEDPRAVTVPLVIRDEQGVLAAQPVTIPAGADIGLSFPVPATAREIEAYLARDDILPQDDAAWAVVPSAPRLGVTLVGTADRLAPLVRAFGALGTVRTRILTPARFLATHATGEDLLVLDGWLPAAGLPAAPALLLIDPPTLPGGRVAGYLDDATVSGVDETSPLLADVDLTALDIPARVARRVTLPSGLAPIVWSAGGALLAAGREGTRQVAVLSFDPSRSDLARLDAFPLLLRNLVAWAAGWLPAAAAVGDTVSITAPPGATQVTISRIGPSGASEAVGVYAAPNGLLRLPTDLPGLYIVTEHGGWGSRSGLMALNAAVDDATAPAPLAATGAPGAPASRLPQPWWPWIGLAATAVLALEWLYVWRRAE